MQRRLSLLLLPVSLIWSLGSATHAAAAQKQAARHKAHVVAYINVTSGCQRPTEAVLKRLADRYKGLLKLEVVDFGGTGRARWLRDGMHCMGIRINGNIVAKIVEKGVPLTVRFQMPAGYNWTLDELEIAIRQAIEGISSADRRSPVVTVEKTADGPRLTIGGKAVLSLPDAQRLEHAADVLRSITKDKGLAREDFSFDVANAKARVLARGRAVLEVSETDAHRLASSVPALAVRWTDAISSPYPVRTRPLPNARRPHGQGGNRQW